MTIAKCYGECGRSSRDDPNFMCEYCEAKSLYGTHPDQGDPDCSICSGRGWWMDGDVLAGVEWKQTCQCMGGDDRAALDTRP